MRYSSQALHTCARVPTVVPGIGGYEFQLHHESVARQNVRKAGRLSVCLAWVGSREPPQYDPKHAKG